MITWKRMVLVGIVWLMAGLYARGQSSQWVYRNLVMEGGGLRGLAYVGAIEVLDSLHALDSLERVGGSSAGAIEAMLLALGYRPAEMKELIHKIPWRKLNDESFWIGRNFRRLKRNFGWYKGDGADAWIGGIIASKTGNADIDFAGLHQLRKDSGYKDLYITGTDLTHQRLCIFSFETFPRMRIRDAVRISMSIPLYFKAIQMDSAGNIHHTDTNSVPLSVMADGGLACNYPIMIFDSSRYMNVADTLPNHYVWNPETLGLLLEDPEQLESTRAGNPVNPEVIESLGQYVHAVYRLLVDKTNPDRVPLGERSRTLSISNLGLHPRVRKLPPEIIEALLESGREGAKSYVGYRPE